MEKLFLKREQRSFTSSVARARFLWLLIAALLLLVSFTVVISAQRITKLTDAL